MKLEQMERLVAFDYKVNIATEKLKVYIYVKMMDVDSFIREIQDRLKEISDES